VRPLGRAGAPLRLWAPERAMSGAVAERYRLDRGVVTAGKVFGCL
jgi:hypothetical protein